MVDFPSYVLEGIPVTFPFTTQVLRRFAQRLTLCAGICTMLSGNVFAEFSQTTVLQTNASKTEAAKVQTSRAQNTSQLIGPGYELIESFPHYSHGFTQGFTLYQGKLYESSGLYQRSFIIYGDLDRGPSHVRLPADLFAEGLTILNGKLYVLTWKKGLALVLNPDTLQLVNRFQYPGEGWGLTHNGHFLIMSDGSNQLRVIDPTDFRETRKINVTHNGLPVQNLNELEWHRGLILANQWQTDNILVIDERSGKVLRVLNLAALYPQSLRGRGVDVLNGIAYDVQSDTWLVTGKFWPRIYRIRLTPPLNALTR